MCTTVVRYMTFCSVPVKYRKYFTWRFTHTVTLRTIALFFQNVNYKSRHRLCWFSEQSISTEGINILSPLCLHFLVSHPFFFTITYSSSSSILMHFIMILFFPFTFFLTDSFTLRCYRFFIILRLCLPLTGNFLDRWISTGSSRNILLDTSICNGMWLKEKCTVPLYRRNA